MPLRALLHQIDAPDDVAARALCVWGEALGNFHQHSRAASFRYYLAADGRRIKMLAVYRTPRFDTNPPEPALYATSGRGIMLIRALSETIWRFNGGDLWLTMAVPLLDEGHDAQSGI
jgi:hypothetical protein